MLYEECSLGKSHRLPYSGTLRQATTPGELVFADLCGPIDTESIGGKRYACLFVDSSTGMKFVYPITRKSDALAALKKCFLEFKATGNK